MNAMKFPLVIVLAASWPGKIRPEAGLHLATRTELKGADLLRSGLDATVKELVEAGKKVIVIGDSPAFPFLPLKCIGARPYSIGIGSEPVCKIDKGQYLAEHQRSWSVIEQVIADYKHAVFHNLEAYFCDGIECSMRREGKLMFRDNDHLSLDGSKFVGSSIASKIIQLGWLESRPAK